MQGYALGISRVFGKKGYALGIATLWWWVGDLESISWIILIMQTTGRLYVVLWVLREQLSKIMACLCCFLRDTLDQETFLRWTPTVEEKTSMILIHSFFRKKFSSNAFFWRKSPYGDGTSTAIQHWWPIFMMVSGREGHLKAQHISWCWSILSPCIEAH